MLQVTGAIVHIRDHHSSRTRARHTWSICVGKTSELHWRLSYSHRCDDCFVRTRDVDGGVRVEKSLWYSFCQFVVCKMSLCFSWHAFETRNRGYRSLRNIWQGMGRVCVKGFSQVYTWYFVNFLCKLREKGFNERKWQMSTTIGFHRNFISAFLHQPQLKIQDTRGLTKPLLTLATMLQSPTGPSWIKASQLDVLITRACDPSLHEPNYAMHLEVADHINKKKANTYVFLVSTLKHYLYLYVCSPRSPYQRLFNVNSPREAAMTIARLGNHRNPHVAILALALLDTLVQSCGYPFHLQISTKEFLNELVRRFPERPPPFPGPVMSRILDLIHRWKEGICTESRWKEDLGNIRDMHRLLTFKGYRFRDLSRQTNAATTATAVCVYVLVIGSPVYIVN